ETVGGRDCAKNKVVVKNPKGATVLEAITWNAAEAKDFPVQIAVQTTEGLTVVRFTQIKFAKPAPAQFDSPKNFERYSSPDALLIAAAHKQQSAKPPTSSPQNGK